MGAIAGWVSTKPADEAGLGAMLQKLAHRSGVELAAFVDTGRSRQAVLGASAYDPHARIAVALDGAIVNRDELRAILAKRGHAFTGQSDDELLLKAYQHWDQEVVKHLRGAFAFAIWDARKDRLLLGRDRFGEKPLYLRESDGALHFASEVKALAAPGADIDVEAVWEHLACRYVPGPRTLLKGIRKLAPATYAAWQFRKLRETRYWVPPDRNPYVEEAVSGDPVDGFLERLGEAVKLNQAERTGIFLSGGIDSLALLALAAKRGGRLHTFSVGFAGDNDGELLAAASAAQHFGAEDHVLEITPRDLVAHLPRLVGARDAPLSRPSDVALHLLAAQAASVVPVVLTGEGSDEVLGGYRRHAAERFAWAFRSLPTVLALVAPIAGPRARTAVASLQLEDWRERSLRWNGGLTRAEREKISVLHLNGSLIDSIDADPAASSLRRMLYFEQVSSLADNLLERDDRMTMAASLEARAPFLDYRLAEYVSRLPDNLRVRGLATKWILRRAVARLVPPGALGLRKTGWLSGTALRAELRELAADHLRGERSLTRAYYEPKVLDRVLDEHDTGRRGHEELLWTLLNLEIWHRTNSASVSTPAHA